MKPPDHIAKLEELCRDADTMREHASALKDELTQKIEAGKRATGYDGIDRRKRPRRDAR